MGKYTYSDGTTPNICIIGAGFSGLTAAIKLKKDLKISSFQVFDENTDVGGTWLVNTYPGCACDIESHLYSWSFEPNPNWSKVFSPHDEIWEYMRGVTRKYDLYNHIKFNSKVLQIQWEEDIRQWRVTFLNKATNEEKQLLFDLVINGPGALRLPNYPKEFDAFTGPKIHTAEWDSTIELENKVVGIIGSGASAVQVITDIAPKVKELHSFQRKPAWITPRGQKDISENMKWVFRVFPIALWLYRCCLFLLNEMLHSIFIYNSWLNKAGHRYLQHFMRGQLPKDDPKVDLLMPNYTLGCKRIVRSSEYYPTLALSHVAVIRDKIIEIKDDIIRTEDGKSTKLDVLILATGFQVQNYFDPLKIIGRDGRNIIDTWKTDIPRTYYGIATSMTPNNFILHGPNTALGHNTVVFMIECQANFVMNVIKEMIQRNARCVSVKSSAEDEFLEVVKEKLKKSVWALGNCGSWYTNSHGVVTTIWPFTCIKYWAQTRKLDNSKFIYY